MTNPIATLNGTHELQERYSSLILQKLRANTVFLALMNRRYEGTPTAGAVKIPVRDGEVTVNSNYNVVNGGSMTTSATEYLTLPIDKDDYVNELIDGYEAAAVPDNLVADRLDSAGYALAKNLDTTLSTMLTTTGNYTASAAGNTALTTATAYDAIIDDQVVLKKAHVKVPEMWLVVAPETTALLLKDTTHFIKASDLGDSFLVNGQVGKIAGMPVIESDNLPTGVEYIIGNSIYAHYVGEWAVLPAIKDLADGKHIGASALQGRRVHGETVSRPTTIIVKKK